MIQAEVIINKIEAPESITMNIGESYYTKLDGMITVLPELEDMGFTYSISPKKDTDAEGFNANGGAVKSGTYTLLITCNENPKATAEVVVTVLTPVVITYPTNITLSKFKDTQLELTLVEGDNFDPELVEVRFMANQDVMPGVPEPVTYSPVAGSNNLKWNILRCINIF